MIVAAYLLLVVIPFLLWKYLPFNRKSFEGKTILITGAGSGIGKQLAIHAAVRKRCNVILLDIRPHFLKETKKEILDILAKEQISDRIRIDTHPCDVSNIQDVERVLSSISREIDVLVNNAGIVIAKDIEDLTPKEFMRTLEVNTFSPFLMTKHLLPQMKERNSGLIVNISSVMGHVGCAKLSEYCASKHGLVGFHDSLRLELLRDGFTQKTVGTLLVCPSAINTGMFDGLYQTWLMRLFSPILEETYVADMIFRAMERGDHVLYLPHLVACFFPIARLLPTPLKDFLTGHFGGFNGISTSFKGRGSAFSMGEDIEKKIE